MGVSKRSNQLHLLTVLMDMIQCQPHLPLTYCTSWWLYYWELLWRNSSSKKMAEVVFILKSSAMGVGLSSLHFSSLLMTRLCLSLPLYLYLSLSFSLFPIILVIFLLLPQFSFLSYLKLLISQNGKKIVLMYHPKSMQIGNRSYFIRYDSS